MANVLVENATLQNIANAIRSKTGKTETMLPAEMSAEIESISGGEEQYDQGYEDGANSVPQLERYLKSARFTSLNIFGKSDVTLNFDNLEHALNLFQVVGEKAKNTTVEYLTLNFGKKVSTLLQMLYIGDNGAYDYTLKRVTFNGDTSASTSFRLAFCNLKALETIDGTPFDFSLCTQGPVFSGCNALTDFRVVANTIKFNFSIIHSSNLSVECAKNIILGAVNYIGTDNAYAYTMTFSSKTLELLEAEGATSPSGTKWLDYLFDEKGWNY